MAQPTTGEVPVRSVQRALAVLEALARRGEAATLTSIADELDLAVPTTFRIMRTLVAEGYAQQVASRRYGLGPGIVRLGDRTTHWLEAWAQPVLAEVVDDLRETANLAVLDGDMMVYVAQVASSYGMRMFTEVGQRVHAHCSGVGKAILATLPDAQIHALLQRTGMPRSTSATLVTEHAFFEEIARIRLRGYAIDDGEEEVGVRCLATAVRGWPAPMAISVSGPSTRVPIAATTGYAEVLVRAATRLTELFAARAELGTRVTSNPKEQHK